MKLNIILFFSYLTYIIYKLIMMDFNEYIFESYLSESILYFSPRFREQLNSISDNKVAKDLINTQGSNTNNDVTLIDTSDYDNNYLSFMPINKAQKMIDDYHPGAMDGSRIVRDFLVWKSRKMNITRKKAIEISAKISMVFSILLFLFSLINGYLIMAIIGLVFTYQSFKTLKIL
jgi:hypothetical protein